VSLIDEALRRAQAAQTTGAAGAAGPRVPMPLPDSGRYRRRRMLRLALGALAVAAVAGGGILLLRGRGRVSPPRGVPPAPSTSSSSGVAGSAATPTATTTQTPGGSAALPAEKTSGESNLAATPTQTPGLTAAPAGAAPPSTATPAPDAAAPKPRRAIGRVRPVILPPVEVSNASASPRVANEDRPPGMEPPPEPPSRARTYKGTANLPSARLELEGIVYSEGSPKALINGRVVGPGGYVEGYTVVRIERDRVELKGDDDGTIILTLK
jgi:hypothetical protein